MSVCARNVLLTQDFTAKIGDLGISKRYYEICESQKAERFDVRC